MSEPPHRRNIAVMDCYRRKTKYLADDPKRVYFTRKRVSFYSSY